jgi:aryl carrier-like protein
MNLAPERQLAHAQVLRARGSALPFGELPAEAILDSWSRCLRSGLDFARARRFP